MNKTKAILAVIPMFLMSGPAPANDDCADAIPVFNGSFLSDTTSTATTDGGAACDFSAPEPDRWYVFNSPVDAWLTASTCGTGTAMNTVVSIHTGCPGTETNQVACNGNWCTAQGLGGFQGLVSAGAAAGQDYYIRVAGSGTSGPYTVEFTAVDAITIVGADALYTETIFQNFDPITQRGQAGTIHAYGVLSSICNLGDEDMGWDTTLMGWNAHRVSDGRFLQIGQSWLKNGDSAAPTADCGTNCNGNGGPVLGAGCNDVYTTNINSFAGGLGKRSDTNAFTGAYAGESAGTGDPSISERLQIEEADMDLPGASYFLETILVQPDDAFFGNWTNNASYQPVAITTGTYDIDPIGPMLAGSPAIYAWQDVEPAVTITEVDVPGEGRFYVGYNAVDLGGTWRYEYSIFNLNSDRAVASFSVPAGGTISGEGFHDVDYHSGEVYDNADWGISVDGGGVTWSSPQTFAENENTNALRFGTTYSFWYDSTNPPETVSSTLGLFKPGSPSAITVDVLAAENQAVCNNGACEAGEDCINCPSDCRQKTNGNPSSRYCCDGGLPDCGDSRCNEDGWVCGGGCTSDADCDDDQFCNGVEICSAGTCQSGTDPCPGQSCNETTDQCQTCGGNKEACNVNGDCCSGNCTNGSCRGN